MEHDVPADILVVEDNDVQRAFIVASLMHVLDDLNIVEAADVDGAIKLLLSQQDEPPLSLILLDLMLPGGNAFEVLKQIRVNDASRAMAQTPVVVFSDSQDPDSIEKCYRGGANSYVIKPLSHEEFQHVVEDIARYWLILNQTPP